jgi:hypothetical protein
MFISAGRPLSSLPSILLPVANFCPVPKSHLELEDAEIQICYDFIEVSDLAPYGTAIAS